MTSLVIERTRDTQGTQGTQGTRGTRGTRTAALRDEIVARRWESGLVFVAFALAYTALGQWLVRDVHVVGFEALARFQRAMTLALNPAHGPAALSDDPTPLATLLTAPFTVVPVLLRSFAVVPVVSAVFAAATMVVLDTAMRRAGLGAVVRTVGLLVVGFNPLVLLYAADGDRLFLALCFALGAISAVMAWRTASDVRFLLVAGLAFALAVMCDYDMLAWLVITVVTVGATLVRLGARGDEVESTVVALCLPTAAALGLWVLFGLVITGRPFSWLAQVGRDPLVPLPAADQVELAGALAHTGSLVLHGAPLAAVVLPALLYRWLVRRDPFAGVLAALLATVALLPGSYAVLGRSGPPQLRDAVPILLVSVLGAVWLVAGSAITRSSRVVGVVALAVLAVSVPWTFRAMSTYDDQVLEASFADAVRTGRSQEGALTAGGQQVGYASEAAMAGWIHDHVSPAASILTDDHATYAVLLRTASPGLFRDTVDSTADRWRDLAADPGGGGIDYLLLTTDPRTDRLGRLHPEAAAGTDPRLPVVHRTPRYVLVEVLDGAVDGTGDRP